MFVAGEASAEQYGARVIMELKRRLPGAKFFGIGGDAMRDAGMELLFHIRETSVMGFLEVAKNYRRIDGILRSCTRELRTRRPDLLVLIDYPGFNLKLAAEAKASGIKVVYYIAPQVWAWGKHRVKNIRERVSELAVVFPFEETFFRREGVHATFVGHPLLEILPNTDRKKFLKDARLQDGLILALLPGSREQELQRMLPVMIEAAKRLREKTGCIPAIGAAQLPDEIYFKFLRPDDNIPLLRNQTHSLMQHAHAAIVTSGTATVELAFYQTPMVIVYKAAPLNYFIGKRLVKVPNIGMVNLLAEKEIVPELIQNEMTADAIFENVLPFLIDKDVHEQTQAKLGIVRSRMGEAGASARVADLILSALSR
jgi:lipid-A-disaccharide synthase